MQPIPDGSLLSAYAKGDERAFTALMERHWPQVLSVVRRWTGSSTDAEDGAQAVFLALSRRARALTGRASLAGWLHLAAANVGRRMADAARARRRREAQAAAPLAVAAGSAELAIALDEAISALPERERLAVLLHHHEGRPHDEAAALLGWPVGTFAARLSRGRARLRRRLRIEDGALGVALLQARPHAIPAPALCAAPSPTVAALASTAGAGGIAATPLIAAALAALAIALPLAAGVHARLPSGTMAAAGARSASAAAVEAGPPGDDERLVRAFLEQDDAFRRWGPPRALARVATRDWPLASRFYWVQWGDIDDLSAPMRATLVRVHGGSASSFNGLEGSWRSLLQAELPGGPRSSAAAEAVARAILCVDMASGSLRLSEAIASGAAAVAPAEPVVDPHTGTTRSWRVACQDTDGAPYGQVELGADSTQDQVDLVLPSQGAPSGGHEYRFQLDDPRPVQTLSPPVITRSEADPAPPTARQ